MRYLVLCQAADPSYNDCEGCLYHFPYTYRSGIEAGDRFVYYRPRSSCYFGEGRIGRVIPDPKCTRHWYATIMNYRPFPRQVYYKDKRGDYLEARPDIKRPAFMRSVRSIESEVFSRILRCSGFGEPRQTRSMSAISGGLGSPQRVGLLHRAQG